MKYMKEFDIQSGFDGELIFDTDKPDRIQRKLLNVDWLTRLGWTAKTPLGKGRRLDTYEWYQGVCIHK